MTTKSENNMSFSGPTRDLVNSLFSDVFKKRRDFLPELAAFLVAIVVLILGNLELIGLSQEAIYGKLAAVLSGLSLVFLGWRFILAVAKILWRPSGEALIGLGALSIYAYSIWLAFQQGFEGAQYFEIAAFIIAFGGLSRLAQRAGDCRVFDEWSRTERFALAKTDPWNEPADFETEASRSTQIFFWITIVVSLGAYFYWFKVVGSLHSAVMNSVSVLVIASPLSFFSSGSVLLGASLVGLAKRKAFLNDPAALDEVSGLSHVAFNKSGLLTEEDFEDIQIFSIENVSHKDVLQFAASAEMGVTHFMSQALLGEAEKQSIKILQIQSQVFEASKGVSAEVFKESKAHRVSVGNLNWIYENGFEFAQLPEKLKWEADGSDGTVLWVAVDDKILGIIILKTSFVPGVQKVIEELSDRYDVGLITGDSENASSALAKKLQLKFHHYGVGPLEKSLIIRRLQEKKKKGIDFIFPSVAYIGDGYQDELAMKEAHLSLEISSLSKQSVADILMAREAREGVPEVFRFLIKASAILKQNSTVVLVYHLMAWPLAAGAFLYFSQFDLSPALASAASSLCCVSVVANSLRLLRD